MATLNTGGLIPAIAASVGSGGGGGVGGGSEGFESPFDLGMLSELFAGLGPSPQELGLIEQQTAAIQQQMNILNKQLRLQDIFAEFQVEQGGFNYVRSPSDFAGRQKLGEAMGLSPTGTVGQRPEDPRQAKRYDRQIASLAKQLGTTPDQLKPGMAYWSKKAFPAAGELMEITPGEMALKRQTLEGELLDHSLKALRGELPVSPTLARSFKDRDALLQESLRRQLGTGYETSSPGIEALATERQFQTEALEAARRGELSMAEQFGLARGGQRLSETGVVANSTAPNFAIASGFGNVGAGFGNAAATSIAGRQASIAGMNAALGGALGFGNLALGGQELGLRNRALDIQAMLGLADMDLRRQGLGIQSDSVSAARDAALWNAIGTGVGVLGGIALS